MKDKISLAGDLGSGKSTVSDIIINKTGAEYYSTGAIVRNIAKSKGMTVVELNHYMETHPEIDEEIDNGLRALSDVDKQLIIDSRMAWHFVRDTFKVYLSTDIETSAARIMSACRDCEHALTLEETIEQTRQRKDSEKKRYFEQYGVNIKDLFNYDLIIDTTYASPLEVAETILMVKEEMQGKAAQDRHPGKEDLPVRVYISPERLNYPEEGCDTEVSLTLSGRLECGEDIPEIKVAESDGEFYVEDGFESAMAYALADYTFVPAKLVKADISEKKYVKMKNSL